MQIIVLDGVTLNPGDLSWDGLQALGPCEVYDRTPQNEVVARAQGAAIVLTNKTELDRETIARLPQLKYIGVLATGYNCVDAVAARQAGVAVTNVPTYGTRSVAEMVFAHLFEFTRHVSEHAQTARIGRWTRSGEFCYWDYPLIELDGLTLGIVGYGRIGRATARLGQAFGMKVQACDAMPIPAADGVAAVDLDTLFSSSDVVSLHCPLTPETDRMVDRRRLERMKPSAYLINTSRGGLIDEAALAEALNAGRIAGAGLDVLTVEPPPPDHPLLTARNCCVTPHIAWATRAARSRLLDTAVENVRAFLAGRPQNVVN
jgi:glycerate dehydrogenase